MFVKWPKDQFGNTCDGKIDRLGSLKSFGFLWVVVQTSFADFLDCDEMFLHVCQRSHSCSLLFVGVECKLLSPKLNTTCLLQLHIRYKQARTIPSAYNAIFLREKMLELVPTTLKPTVETQSKHFNFKIIRNDQEIDGCKDNTTQLFTTVFTMKLQFRFPICQDWSCSVEM